MNTVNGSVRQTVGRFVVAGLAAAAVASPVVWSLTSSVESPASVVTADSGLDQLQWIYNTQPHAQAPHVDTTVHQSR